MKNLFSTILGLAMIGYLIYVVVQVIQITFGENGGEWSEISIHLIGVSILIILMLIGLKWGDKKEKTEEEQKPNPSPTQKEKSQTMGKLPYNPLTDKLEFTVYQQSFETWWSDDYGDKQYHSTVYANLRFYEDGTVIGIRSSVMPKKEVVDSFTLQGKWTAKKNEISFELEKVSEVDDTIKIYLSEADHREMKYTGQIADDKSLIQAGAFKGTIQGGTLSIGSHIFIKIPLLKLIVTTDEKTCEQLEASVSSHPDVVYTFQDTGNWYSNGETGPEWFTVSIGTASELKEKIEALVNEELNKLGESGNLFWDYG